MKVFHDWPDMGPVLTWDPVPSGLVRVYYGQLL